MFWEETGDKKNVSVSDDIVDAVFKISCPTLPVDHAYALYSAVLNRLPWIEEEGVGLHTIHVAASGNGWMRPEDPNELLHPSRRTRFAIRVPKKRIDDVGALSGASLDIKGNVLDIHDMEVRELHASETLFARYIVATDDDDEEQFLQEMFEQLKSLDIHARKMMCGRQSRIETPQGSIKTRSMMLADLELEDSVKLQQRGLGPLRHMGCGLLIPHRGIKAVSSRRNEDENR